MKNKNKQSKQNENLQIQEVKENENIFADIVIEKRKLLKIIRSTASFAGKYENNCLRAIKIRVKNDSLALWATDGNRAIETKLEISNDGRLKEVEVVVYAHLLTGLCFNVSNGDYIRIIIDKEYISFDDSVNGTYYKLKTCDFIYPNVEKVMNDCLGYGENELKVAFNRRYMENMKNLLVNERHEIIEAIFNKEDALKPILYQVFNNDELIQQRAVLMPIDMRR